MSEIPHVAPRELLGSGEASSVGCVSSGKDPPFLPAGWKKSLLSRIKQMKRGVTKG